MTTVDRPYFYETESDILCGPCRRVLLANWSPDEVARKGGTPDEVVRPSDLSPMGRTPWAGAPAGDRFVMCSHCQEFWGPDA